jgi:hypothetical protein
VSVCVGSFNGERGSAVALVASTNVVVLGTLAGGSDGIVGSAASRTSGQGGAGNAATAEYPKRSCIIEFTARYQYTPGAVVACEDREDGGDPEGMQHTHTHAP